MTAKKRAAKKQTVPTTTDSSTGETESFSLPISDPAGAWFRAALLYEEIELHLGQDRAHKIFTNVMSKRRAQRLAEWKLLHRLDQMKPKPIPFRLARVIATEEHGADVTKQNIDTVYTRITR